MAIYLLTNALGNAFVVLVSELSLMKLAYELFFYAGLMVVFTLLFMLLIRKFEYVENSQETQPLTKNEATEVEPTTAVSNP